MKKVDFKRDLLPHLVVVAAFLLLVILYFSPIFFDKKSLDQHDITQWKGSAQEIIAFRKQYHEEPLWTNSMFGGMPSAFVATSHFGDIFIYVHQILTLGLPNPVSLIFIMLMSFYLLLLAFDIKPLMASIGALGFALASFTLISLGAGHNAKIMAMAYMPLALAAAVWAFRKHALAGSALFGLAFALQIRCSHLQITYYLAMVLVFLGISELIFAIKNKTIGSFLKSASLLLVFGLIGIACNFGSLLYNYEYSKASIRGEYLLKPLDSKEEKREEGLDKDYAFDYSYEKSETFTLLVPNFYGGGSGAALDKNSATYKAMVEKGVPMESVNQFTANVPVYFGGLNFTAGPVYAGAIICFLFVLGLLIVDNRWKWWLLSGTLLSFMLSWGSYFPSFNYFMFDHFPLYNKFRAVTMAMVIAQVTMPLLAILALDKVLKSSMAEIEKPLKIAVGVVVGTLVLIMLFAGSGSLEGAADAQLREAAGGEWLLDAVKEDRVSMVRADAFRSLMFILGAIVCIYLVLINKLKANLAIGIIALLTLIDLWSVDKRYVNKNNFAKHVYENYFTPTEADLAILEDKSLDYRVFNLNNPFNDARTSYFHKSIGGYCAAKMRSYQDVIERNITPEMQNIITAINNKTFTPQLLASQNVLNMLNTKYIILGESKDAVLQNPYALGNAWYVNELIAVQGADAEIGTLNKINPRTTAVIDAKKFAVSPSKFDTTGAKVILEEYKPNYLKYNATSVVSGFIVFSEIYYKHGWQAYMDGEKIDNVRVNYILRGILIPAGKHKIEFKFHPDSYFIGNNIGLYSSVALLLIIAGVFAIQFKKQN